MLSALAFSLAVLSLSSCSKDEDPDPVLGQLTIDGVEYPLYDATFFPSTEAYYNDLEEVMYDHDMVFGGGEHNGMGIGFVSDVTELVAATYTYRETEFDWQFDIGDFRSCAVTTKDFSYSDVTSGTVNISKSGDIYTIDVDAVVDGHEVSVHYEGKVDVVV